MATMRSMVPYQAQSAFELLDRTLNEIFSESFFRPWFPGDSLFGGWSQRIAQSYGTNLWETDDAYIVQLAMPAVKPESIDCRVHQNLLMVKAEGDLKAPEGARSIWQGFGAGTIELRIQLPAPVEAGEANATYENGVVTVRLPKVPAARSHHIPVKVAAGK